MFSNYSQFLIRHSISYNFLNITLSDSISSGINRKYIYFMCVEGIKKHLEKKLTTIPHTMRCETGKPSKLFIFSAMKHLKCVNLRSGFRWYNEIKRLITRLKSFGKFGLLLLQKLINPTIFIYGTLI